MRKSLHLCLVLFLVESFSAKDEFINVPPRRRSYVSAGHHATYGQFPWAVSLQFWEKSYGSWFCSASVIGEDTVLTASHCLCGKPTWVKVRAGLVDTYVSSPNEQVLYMKSIHMSEEWKWAKTCDWDTSHVMNYDIGVLKTKTKFKFNRFVQPIKLSCEIPVPPGLDVYLVGFGRARKSFNQKGHISGHLRYGRLVTRRCDWRGFTVCSWSRTISMLPGDSGGPLTALNNDGTYRIVGINSAYSYAHYYGKPKTDSLTSYYGSVYNYCHWVKKFM